MNPNQQPPDQIQRIREKLEQLKHRDKNLRTFGARQHQFQLNSPLTADEIGRFEQTYGLKLPDGFAQFLELLGNGGAGPAYGLKTLDESLFADLDFPTAENRVAPELPFPHSEPQFMMDEDGEPSPADEDEFAEKWEDPAHHNGLLRLCNLGCGMSASLVVNGPEYGNIWIDDRASEAGIYPFSTGDNFSDRVTFLDWYEIWLDQSLNAVKPQKN